MRYQDTWQFARHVAALLGSLGSLGMFHSPKSLKMAARRPTGRSLRNLECPFQRERFFEAAEKRQRKAEKLTRNTDRSSNFNYAHTAIEKTFGHLNPFYVNR